MQPERSRWDEMERDGCLPWVPSHTTHTESEAVTATDTALPSLRVPIKPSPGVAEDKRWVTNEGEGRRSKGKGREGE
jgi:hypothetical protein